MYCLLTLSPQCSTIAYFSFTVPLAIHTCPGSMPIPRLYVLHPIIWPCLLQSSYNQCHLLPSLYQGRLSKLVLSSASGGLLAINIGCYNPTKWHIAANINMGLSAENLHLLCFFCEQQVVSAIPGDLSNLNCAIASSMIELTSGKSKDRHFACFSNLLISSEVNGPVADRSTRYWLIWLIEAVD